VERAKLKARDHEIDLTSRLNKTQVQSITMSASQQAGYYCEVCDCMLKDSLAYLDHLNGKYHNRNLGMNMDVERSTVDQVRQRLERAKQRKAGQLPTETHDHIPDGMGLLENKKDEKEDSDSSPETSESEDDEEQLTENNAGEDDFAAIMGFAGFGGSKKDG